MVETTNEVYFQRFYQEYSLDEIIEALEITRAHNNSSQYWETVWPLMAQLYRAAIVKGNDSCVTGIAKAQMLSVFYREHSIRCDEAITRWYEGNH